MRNERFEKPPAWSAWRAAFFPAFALLGAALPICFVTWIEPYLFYLRPLELIPTYGTAWLLLAVVVIPVSALCGLALEILDRLPNLRPLRTGLSISLIAVSALATMAALTFAVVIWVRTFGLLADKPIESGIVVFSVVAVGVISLTHRGREMRNALYSVGKWGTALGATSLLSLPFSGWSHDAQAPSTEQLSRVASWPSQPHILLVTIDALSAEHMSLYGARRETTPRLAEFARTAITFDRAYANSNFTTAGVASILTSTRPWTHRAIHLMSWPTEEARQDSLPAMLHEMGYQTHYVATNPYAGPGKSGMASYFDAGSGDRVPQLSFCNDTLSAILPYDCPASALPPFTFAQEVWSAVRRIFLGDSNWHFDPRIANKAALDWLAAAEKRKPLFLWVHFLPPHSPYAAPEPWLGQFDSSQRARDAAGSVPKSMFLFADVPKERVDSLEARYDESVKYVDHFVGELLTRALELLGDNTVVIVTADHGESFEHGYGSHTGPRLFEPIIHIPLIIKLPSQTRALRTSSLAEQIDIAPTLANLAGFTPPSSWEGHSLLDSGLRDIGYSSRAAAPEIERAAFTMNFEENPSLAPLTTGSIAVIDGRWKLVRYLGALHYPHMPKLQDELYDLALDPGELTNRISEHPEEAEHLRELISRELSRHGGAMQ